jgi:hypothetical protein
VGFQVHGSTHNAIEFYSLAHASWLVLEFAIIGPLFQSTIHVGMQINHTANDVTPAEQSVEVGIEFIKLAAVGYL